MEQLAGPTVFALLLLLALAARALPVAESSSYAAAHSRALHGMFKESAIDLDIPIHENTPPCPALSKELLQKHARGNLVLLMAVDKMLMKRFGPSWIENVKAAGITYWYIAALDPWTSKALGALGVTDHCFNAPMDQLGYRGEGTSYQWGSLHWHQTTWNKVFIVRAVYAMGFDVLHSDADSTWWRDPFEWLQQFTRERENPPHALFSTDSLETKNEPGDNGVEAGTSPYYNINTGIYWVKQHKAGMDFFNEWLRWHPQNVGHDQDGLNNVVRGRARMGDKSLPEATWDEPKRLVWCATNKTTAVSYLPVHLYGNAYTYVTGKVHILYNSPLFVTHWVWTGGSPECKIQNLRDAMKYADAPEYYGNTSASVVSSPGAAASGSKSEPAEGGNQLMLLTMDLDRPPLPEGFNQLKHPHDTEQMIQFHLAAGSWQLQQAYWGIMAAVALKRVYVLPGFHCFCARNWYMTQACRINGEPHTQFPYMCALADLLRARKTLAGIRFKLSGGDERVLHVREYSFLNNHKVPQEIKESRLSLVPLPEARQPGSTLPTQLEVTKAPGGTFMANVPWPLNTDELIQLLGDAAQKFRIIHLANATKIMGGGWAKPVDWAAFDFVMETHKAVWCCRSPDDQKKLNLTDKAPFYILPPQRQRVAHQLSKGAIS